MFIRFTVHLNRKTLHTWDINVLSQSINIFNQLIGLIVRVFANGLGDPGSVPRTLKMVLDTSLLNTNKYKVRIEGKVEQSRERSSTLPYTSV